MRQQRNMKNLLIICPINNENSLTRETVLGLKCVDSFYDIVMPKNISPAISICKELWEDKFQHERYLLIDSDIEFTLQDIKQLESKGKNIISGSYTKTVKNGNIIGNHGFFTELLNGENRAVVAGKWGSQIGLIGGMIDQQTCGVNQIDWCGTGFLLLRASAIKRIVSLIKQPLFYHHTVYAESFPFGKTQTSYDIGFAINCHEANEPIFVDCDCKVNHVIRRKQL